MFTGIVRAMGTIAAKQDQPAGMRLVIDQRQGQLGMIAEGDSICVSGVCLTVVLLDGTCLGFDVIAETRCRTTLGALPVGASVNLESSVTATTPLGGHFVQGHVEAVGRVTAVEAGDGVRITIEPPAELMAPIIAKGSIAIDGVSMTVAGTGPRDFQVAVIPTTMVQTTLWALAAGAHVNLETDIISRTVVETVRRMGPTGSITHELLRDAGFVPDRHADLSD